MKVRDDRLDKAKGILIFLVVLGHFLQRITGREDDFSRLLMTIIYSFHMPAFVFLAGITAKSNKLLDRVLVFVVLVVTAQPVYRYWVTFFDEDPDVDIYEPYWITWFLLAMVWWFLLLPLIERFPKVMLVSSLVIGVIGGLLPELDYELSIARTLTFLPFFVVGKLYGMRLLRWAGSLPTTHKLGLVLLSAFTIAAIYFPHLEHAWLYGSRGFEYLDVSVPYGLGLRAFILISAFVTTLVVLSWSGSLPDFLVTVGKRSLAIYLVHGLVVRALDNPLNDLLDDSSVPLMIVVSIALSVLVTWCLSLSWFDWAIRWYSNTVAGWIARALRAPFQKREETGR
ncbi:MAG TPA: acyltransferase family protein [Candidatus Corynebacterium avicola]|uniref:Acyltransferase family protein n=1 Tax=Candidatus Corynebacterium avicola TaxID=2838527 RepID=A0A9D1RPU0_9CORY|nr:acyltransferase family protein [Candidatus Corynebacterium avicola]